MLAYFDQVMQQRFLPSGRVRWLPMSEHSKGADSSHQIQSLTSGERQQVTVRRKVVNATHAQTAVPSTHPSKYAVAPEVRCVPVNQLPQIDHPYACCTVVGSGKTGMDAVLWLLQNGVPPHRTRWIMPRDAWLLDRANSQPGADDFERTIGSTIGSTIGQFESIAEATSLTDLFARLEQRGLLMRIDRSVEPTTYRCAVVSQAELAQLRRIEDVVRMGHVKVIDPTQIVLNQGTVPADP